MSLCRPVLIRRFPLAHETNRAIPSPSGSGPPQRPDCRVCDLSWLPSLLPRWRRLTLPSKPYDDRRNAVKEKGRFGVPAEGRGVHPPVPWIMDTVIDDAPAAGMRSRSPRDGVLNATLPRRAAPACVPDIRFWLAGDDAGTSGLRRFPTLTASSCALPLNPAATRYLD